MPVPDFQTLMLPVLKAFAEGAQGVGQVLPLLKAEFHISEDEASEMLPSGRVTFLQNRAHWARTYLSKAGLLTSPRRGVHQVTEAGRSLLATNPSRIDIAVLEQFKEFHSWRALKLTDKHTGSSAVQGDEIVSFDTLRESSATPEEIISTSFSKLEAALSEELLELLYTLNPVRFERLILDLLKAMGYGAGSLGSHQMTRSTGDGGIDGIIHEDALGLDAVYIQAKRYAAENKVGRPSIQQFIGSLTGEGATKGVFVTTSDFSAEARGYLAKVQHRVVLIGGVQLARLMIRHGVGVRDRVSYVIKSVDEDYFADPVE